jgi:hypothetical protein
MARRLLPLAPTSKHFSPARLVFATQRAVRWPCRCRHKHCEARVSLRLHPDSYRRPRKCPSCRRKDTLRVDWYRVAREWRVRPCRCSNYTFPHARGRGYCEHNPSLTAEQLKERYEQGRWA